MSIHFIIALISGFLGFVVPISAYRIFFSVENPFSNNPRNKQLFLLSLILAPLIICSVDYLICFDNRDFITSFNFLEFAAPFICTVLLFLISEYHKTAKFFVLFLFIFSLTASLIIPNSAIANIIPLPVIYNRIILIATWFIFAYLYRYINNGASLAIQSATISLGIAILALIDAIPFFLGLAGLVLAAASVAIATTTWPPATKYLSDNEASSIGFMIFSLMAWTSTEGGTSCTLIFAMLFITDVVWALALRLTFLEQYTNIKDNTSYQYALFCGFSPRIASSFLVRGQILVIILGCFQAYSEQQYSLLMFAALISIWLLNKLRNLNLETKSIKDINKEVITDIQDRINELKQYVNEDKDD